MSNVKLIGPMRPDCPRLEIPYPDVLARCGIAGFASPAEDYAGRSFDLNERYIKHKAASYIFQAVGDSMEEYRIQEGDYLIVDRSVTARAGHIVLALVEGEFMVKKWIERGQWQLLCSGGNRYPPIPLNGVESQIWGVVRSNHIEFPV